MQILKSVLKLLAVWNYFHPSANGFAEIPCLLISPGRIAGKVLLLIAAIAFLTSGAILKKHRRRK